MAGGLGSGRLRMVLSEPLLDVGGIPVFHFDQGYRWSRRHYGTSVILMPIRIDYLDDEDGAEYNAMVAGLPD